MTRMLEEVLGEVLGDQIAELEARARQAGEAAGRAAGEAAGRRKDVLRLLQARLGEVPAPLAERIAATDDLSRLDALFTAALQASTHQEVSDVLN